MSPIPTESRIFANRYSRELKQKERLHAHALSPGAKTWDEAVNALYDRMAAAGSPAKRAAILGKAITYLNAVPFTDMTHVRVIIYAAKRAATLGFIAMTSGTHP